jgi:hypothetical protein
MKEVCGMLSRQKLSMSWTKELGQKVMNAKSPGICPICLKTIEKDNPIPITYAGKGVHGECLRELMKGLKPHQDLKKE